MRRITIASRASKLALAQSGLVGDLIRSKYPDIDITIEKVSTKGDRDKSDFLYKTESVGFFTSEVEKVVLERRADVAVHSFKDLPTAITSGLTIAAVPKRESAADALVASGPVGSIAELPAGATVGTSSLRRIAQLRNIRSDLECVALRGNVETRVNKVADGQIDAAIIACAGLNRLGLAERISAILAPEEFIPAAAQGALAVQIRTDDDELAEIVSKIDDKNSRLTAETERTVLAAMHGGCSIPLGVHATVIGEAITVICVIANIDGTNLIKLSRSSAVGQSQECAAEVAQEVLAAGGKEILERIRSEQEKLGR